ncbi:hypothetical protein B6D29_00410 [Microgenomates bacterium UTCPR1]|nr:MAG: hypothetical protein B6D29_00410 [Microgenomates bacterium UTCPR1]
MKNRTFLEDLFQSIGFIAAIMIALSQYFLSSNFSLLFAQRSEFFNISNIITIVLTFLIVLGTYVNRHNIDVKIYPNTKKRDHYWKQQRQQNDKQSQQPIAGQVTASTTSNARNDKDIVDEPWGFTIYQSAFISVLGCIIMFILLLMSQNILCTAITYVAMVCLAVFPLSVFSIKIYLAREYENRRERIYSETLNKINMYFAGKVSIKLELTDRTNWMYPIRTILLEHNNKMYVVKTDANNPNDYFDISEHKEEKVKENKKKK